MLHFFRKIRRELLANSQTIRYLKYGIGEIILVVIGILIAIQVDNWNEERIAAENTKQLFIQVSDELVQNIKNVDRIIDLYLEKDSLYFKVLNRKVGPEDYETNPRLFLFAFEWYRTGLMDEDFNALIAEKNNLTELQDSLFSELKDLYGTRKYNTDQDDRMINDAHLDWRDRIANEQPWWSNYVKSWGYTDENKDKIIEYALTDPIYLNKLAEVRSREGGHLNGIIWFRTKALNLYNRIAEMLTIKKDTFLLKDITKYDNIKGVYKYDNEENKWAIQGENELKFKLFVKDSLVEEWDIHPYDNTHVLFYSKDRPGTDNVGICRVVSGENGKVLGLITILDIREVNGNRAMAKKIE